MKAKTVCDHRFVALFCLPVSLILVLTFAVDQSHGFPEMIRHGYTNCLSCHASPAGGGALNSYGRALSLEALSRWGTEASTQLLHGVGGGSDWRAYITAKEEAGLLVIGGDVRFIQTHREDRSRRRGSFFLMQSQVEAQVLVPVGPRLKVGGMLAIGEAVRTPGGGEIRGTSSKYHASIVLDDLGHLRAGRFQPNWGLGLADHVVVTRSSLGLGVLNPRDTVEVSWMGPRWNWVLAGSRRLQGELAEGESLDTSVVGQLAYNFGQVAKLGVGVWRSEERLIIQGHVLSRLFDSAYLLAEIAAERPQTADTSGLYALLRLGSEVTKGLQLYLQPQFEQTSLDRGPTRTDRLGLGLQFYPWPHWEFQAQWNKVKNQEESEPADEAFAILHYYL